ncbi:arf-GAP with GTPase, ANK repeat and PH domain-containing protein 1-like, partial [Scleropages formosus]
MYAFVNSQEWTLSGAVPELKVLSCSAALNTSPHHFGFGDTVIGTKGIVGNLASGKSALVHRYLTGTYVQEESPEGGRFKKEIVVDGQSYLLLIRDEGGPPEPQFALWVDAVIFVFSLEDEISFQTVYHYYSRMANYRNTAEVPLVLVGTQDAISAANPRVIDDSRARKLSSDLKRCTYYETCATYGLNVERVFQDEPCRDGGRALLSHRGRDRGRYTLRRTHSGMHDACGLKLTNGVRQQRVEKESEDTSDVLRERGAQEHSELRPMRAPERERCSSYCRGNRTVSGVGAQPFPVPEQQPNRGATCWEKWGSRT